ncbi:MAG TPA: hypothetical protein VM290_02825 [Gaiellaceae bacterium]|nr:hypothetical protein [Gaiellaceae bacterium]
MSGRDPLLERLWGASGLVFHATLLGGVVAAVAGLSASAWILAGALGGVVAAHLAIAAVSYRRTMRRPWPAVAPLPPDDEDW